MIASVVLAFFAIVLVAAGTPRQAEQLFPGRTDRRRRRILRAGSLVLLGVSFALSQAGDDRARCLIEWIGAIGVEALATALAFSLMLGRGRAR